MQHAKEGLQMPANLITIKTEESVLCSVIEHGMIIPVWEILAKTINNLSTVLF